MPADPRIPARPTRALRFAACLASAVAAAAPGYAAEGVSSPRPLNVLFVAADDLRPELGCYGDPIAVSPNIDRLAARGIVFERAYCNQSICSPSRASLMTGLRPETLGVTENVTFFRDVRPDVVTLPEHLAAQGYDTTYIGKIFHGSMSAKKTDEQMTEAEKQARREWTDSLARMRPAERAAASREYQQKQRERWADFGRSWNRKAAAYRPSVPFSGGGYQDPATRRYMARRRTELIAQFGSARDVPPGLQAAPVTEGIDVPDDAYRDGITAEAAVRTLRQFAETPDKPFFLAVGFQKPHLPFIAPKKYWDLYDPAEIPIVTDEFDIVAPSIARHASFELRTRGGVPNYGPIDDDLSRHLRHAYYACVSYIDAQLGKVLDELEATGFAENTVIVFWGDHGWHLGDHGIWGKATNYEVATRVPLIFAGPGVRESSRTDRIAELVDLYPTLLELAGATPKAGLDGDSLVDTLADGAEPDDAAFSQYPCAALREWAAMPLQPAMRESFFGPLISDIEARLAEESPRYDRTLYENEIMGYTVRTDRYRLVLWLDRRDPTGEPYAAELYDHESDTRERSNLADDPAYADVVTRLRGRLLSTYFPDAAGDL